MTNKHPLPNGSSSLAPLPADAALDAYFHEARAKILDVAAILDRIDRGVNAATVAADARLAASSEVTATMRIRFIRLCPFGWVCELSDLECERLCSKSYTCDLPGQVLGNSLSRAR